jgi:4-hydroxybenzoate polyprenyltransferase
MRFMEVVNDFAQLSRIYLAPFTVSIPILGALTVNPHLTIGNLFALGMVGLSAHIFGFSLNDAIDYSLDKATTSRQSRPLITGRISLLSAWLFGLIQVPVALFTYYVILHGSLGGTVLLGVSVILSIAYNSFSKRGPFPRIMPELSLALSVGTLCLCGAMTQSLSLPLRSCVFILALSLILMLTNSVPNHLKDIKTDSDSGFDSFVLAAGSRIIGNDEVKTSNFLWIYSIVLQVMIVTCMLALIALTRIHLIIGILVIFFVLYSSLHLRMLLSLKSFKQIRQSLPLLSGIYSYTALSLFVSGTFYGLLAVVYWLWVLMLVLFPALLAWQIWRTPYRAIDQ